MALARTHLTKGDDTSSLNAYPSASVTPAAGAIVVYGIVTGTSQAVTSVSGCNLTWTLVDTKTFNGGAHRLTVYRGTGLSPTTGIITASLSGGNASGGSWLIEQINDATNGVEFVRAPAAVEIIAASSGAVTMGAFDDPTNGFAYGMFAIDNDTAMNAGAGSGLTKGDEQRGTVPDRTISSVYKLGQPTSMSMSWTGTLDGAAVGMEFDVPAVGGSSGLLHIMMRHNNGGW
jgi:hypothetical protein